MNRTTKLNQFPITTLLFTDLEKAGLNQGNPKLLKYAFAAAQLLENTSPNNVQGVVTKFLTANSTGLIGWLAKNFTNDDLNYETKILACRLVTRVKLARELETTEPLYQAFIEAGKKFEVAVDFDKVTKEENDYDDAALVYDEAAAGMEVLTDICQVLNKVKTRYDD